MRDARGEELEKGVKAFFSVGGSLGLGLLNNSRVLVWEAEVGWGCFIGLAWGKSARILMLLIKEVLLGWGERVLKEVSG